MKNNVLTWVSGVLDTLLGLAIFFIGHTRAFSLKRTPATMLKYLGLGLFIVGLVWLGFVLFQTIRNSSPYVGNTAVDYGFTVCPGCGLQVVPTLDTCPKCNSTIPRSAYATGVLPSAGAAASIICSGCGQMVAPGIPTCPRCGNPVSSPMPGRAPMPGSTPMPGPAPMPRPAPMSGPAPMPGPAPISGPAPMSGSAPMSGHAPKPTAAGSSSAPSGLIGSLSRTGNDAAGTASPAPAPAASTVAAHSGLIGSLSSFGGASGSPSERASAAPSPVPASSIASETPRHHDSDEDHFEHTVLVRNAAADGTAVASGAYSAAPATKICPKCGTSINASAAFCSICGFKQPI